MLITKSRLQGSSIVVTLPTDKGIKPEPNQEYIVIYSSDGSIILIPKITDPFIGGQDGEFYDSEKKQIGEESQND